MKTKLYSLTGLTAFDLKLIRCGLANIGGVEAEECGLNWTKVCRAHQKLRKMLDAHNVKVYLNGDKEMPL